MLDLCAQQDHALSDVLPNGNNGTLLTENAPRTCRRLYEINKAMQSVLKAIK